MQAEHGKFRKIKPLVAAPVTALLCLGTNACGTDNLVSSGSHASSNATANESPDAVAQSRHRDVDKPNDTHYDADDEQILHYGHAGSAGEGRTAAAFVRRYYAVAAAGDGAKACALLDSSLAGSVVEEYGSSNGPPALRGNTCAKVISKLFTQLHRQLAVDNATLHVTGVRVGGDKAYALLRARTTPVGYFLLQREHGAWKAGAFQGAQVG